MRDRLFLTAAVRQDQNSAFGTNFQNVVYPKVSASWLLSDESFFPNRDWLNAFRFRTAYGASGVQPGATAALQTFSPATVEHHDEGREHRHGDAGPAREPIRATRTSSRKRRRSSRPDSRPTCSTAACTSTSRTTTRRRTTR